MKIAFTLLLLVCLLAGCDYFADEPVTYRLVAMRNPSDVAMPLTPPMPGVGVADQALIVGRSLTWLDGSTYPKWENAEVATYPAGRSDPMFGDVYWEPEGVFAAIRTVRYLADEEEIGTVLYVDDQVALVTAPAGAPVSILEKPLSEETALALEAALKDRKFDPGPVDGVIDEQTRRALGFYYEYLGLKYRFKTPVISSAILRELIGEDRINH